MRGTIVRWQALCAAFLGLTLAACADATGPTEPVYAPSLFAEVPLTQEISLCKTGPEGSWASFGISATGGNLIQGAAVTITDVKPFGTFPAACAVIWRSTSATVEYVTITETASSPGTAIESIVVFNDVYQVDLVTGTASVTVSNLEGALVVYKNKSVPVVPPTGRIGDFVWADADQDGVQDAGEAGIPGVTVTLSQGTTTLATTTTDANGGYLFTGLGAGCYTVTAGTPAGMLASPTGAGTPATDSNGSPADVCLPTNSSEDLTIDFGFYTPPPPPTGSLGNFVWNDTDQDGVQDAGEPGIAGVTLTLLIAGNPVAATATDANGGYLFTGLTAGCYTVTAGTPAGMLASPTGAGTPATDSNGSPAAVCLPTNSSEDLTIDFGFYTPTPPPPPGLHGCTPGFWKQKQHFQYWTGYTQSQTWGSVFADPGSTPSNKNQFFTANTTLLGALNLGGGGILALARHAAAALLNSSSNTVDYPYTTAQVIATVNAAIASGDYDTAHLELARFNELGCNAVTR